jgi:hypothetical protein
MSAVSNWADLFCQCIKLVCKRRLSAAAAVYQLTFADHVHEFNARDDAFGRLESFKSKHWSGDTFDCTMVLLNNVIEILDQVEPG